jgi:phosphonate transport system substrate-binding protein
MCRPVQYGSVVYRGQIIVHKESQIENIHQLRNKTFAYVDRYSGSGFYFPNLLFYENKIEPLSYFSEVVFSHSHKRSILGVLNRNFDAAAVFSVNLLESEGESYPETDALRVIARTAPIPNDPLVVRKDLDADLKTGLSRAMLSMHRDEYGKEYLKTLFKLRGTEKFVSEEEVEKIIARER